jgi:hypothetical protein
MDVEWLILADSAQVVGGKLYLLGGGWDNLNVNAPFPIDQKFAIALGIKVAWNETNKKHTFEVEIISEDKATEAPKTLMKAGGQFEIGRPPGILPGQEQRFQIALDGILKIESAGTKTIIVRVEGQEMRRTSFYVHANPNANRPAQ